MPKKKLTTYKEKRDFEKTPEPKAKIKKNKKKPIFVVQEHDARNLHYDFRIENESVLVSWAVPKGPSTNPADKRLAIMTEDHPYDYKDFEGVIPKGQYGAGPVMIWDTGTYENLKDESIAQSLKNGHVNIWLNGEKLKGGYSIIKTHFGANPNSWILVKMNDEEADRTNNILKKQKSVITKRSMNQIKDK